VYGFNGAVLARGLVADTLVARHTQGLLGPPKVSTRGTLMSVSGLTQAGRERADALIRAAHHPT
jgi:hypothetical protein